MGIFSDSEEDKRIKEDEIRIKKCAHKLKNYKSGITQEFLVPSSSHGGYYVTGGDAYTILRCEKGCGFVRKIVESQ